MTYCAATKLDAGIVFASDSRTNAGVDNISTFRKMKVFEAPGERVLVTLCSGNLAITQATINQLEQATRKNEGKHLLNAESMYEVATLIGEALREVRHRDGPFLAQSNVDSTASFIVGGEIFGDSQRLFMVYPEGNFIEATPETPYFQIGETKYGKPILDRVIVNSQTSLDDAVKCVLVSFDSTMRSNLSVGMPIDMVCYENYSLRVNKIRRFEERDPYMQSLRLQWSAGLRSVFAQLPIFDWNN